MTEQAKRAALVLRGSVEIDDSKSVRVDNTLELVADETADSQRKTTCFIIAVDTCEDFVKEFLWKVTHFHRCLGL